MPSIFDVVDDLIETTLEQRDIIVGISNKLDDAIENLEALKTAIKSKEIEVNIHDLEEAIYLIKEVNRKLY